MDHIRQAVERAKSSAPSETPAPESSWVGSQPRASAAGGARSFGLETDLNSHHLEAHRIISHEVLNPRSKPFDILRTQVLQSMDRNSWQVLGVTSPTPGCGKSVVAINLALSIARQTERSALLVDMDMQKPQVANYLGLDCDNKGLMSVLEGRTNLNDALIQARIRQQQLLVLPCETATASSSDWMASRPMAALLQEIKRNFKPWTVVVDLPPLLTSDDVISILPQIDCVLFVAAIGSTTVGDVKECNKYLDASSIVQVVVNKSPDTPHAYYYGYGKKKKRGSRTKVDA